jgi:hypothetical protein
MVGLEPRQLPYGTGFGQVCWCSNLTARFSTRLVALFPQAYTTVTRSEGQDRRTAHRFVAWRSTAIYNGFENVQFRISCVAVWPPVPPVKPTNATFPPTVAAILIGNDVVNVFAGVVVSVIVIVRVVPS